MIISLIAVIFLGIFSVVDSMLGAILPLRAGTNVLVQFLGYVDQVVYFVRSLFPLTISTIFSYLFLLFCIAVVLKFVSLVKRLIPGISRFGSRRLT